MFWACLFSKFFEPCLFSNRRSLSREYGICLSDRSLINKYSPFLGNSGSGSLVEYRYREKFLIRRVSVLDIRDDQEDTDLKFAIDNKESKVIFKVRNRLKNHIRGCI